MTLLEHLQNTIREDMSLAEMIDAFEAICAIPCGTAEELLFQTGTYCFTRHGTPTFRFDLTRQYPDGEDEFYQLHLTVHFAPTEATKELRATVWESDFDSREAFFRHVRTCPAYDAVKALQPAQVEIFLDQT